jgi:hypothetical protein
MAVLIAAELQSIRNGCANAPEASSRARRLRLAAAAQAVEDFLTSNAAAISTAINTATSPVVLTAAQKKELVAQTIYAKYLRDK